MRGGTTRSRGGEYEKKKKKKKRRDMSRPTAVVTCGCVRAADHAVCFTSDVAQVYTREKYHLSFPAHADATSSWQAFFKILVPHPRFFCTKPAHATCRRVFYCMAPQTDMGACLLGRYRDFTAERPSDGVSSASLFRVGDFSCKTRGLWEENRNTFVFIRASHD